MERLLPTSKTPEPLLQCDRCGADASYVEISRVSLVTANFQEQSIDVLIGNDSERRWSDIEKRQKSRDKVRQQTGSLGLSMVGRNDFAPLAPEDKKKRSEIHESLKTTGYGKVES
jgi:hypothetical protein